MAIDFTRLVEKLNPDPGAEDPLRLRVATVTTVNANGTLDITMSSGVLVPGVPKLATAYAPAGAVVQVITLRGSLLVIGAVASGGALGAMTKTGSTVAGPAGAASLLTTAIPFGVTFPAIPNVHINLTSGASQANSWVGRAITITTSSFILLAYGPSNTFSATWQWTAIYAP